MKPDVFTGIATAAFIAAVLAVSDMPVGAQMAPPLVIAPSISEILKSAAPPPEVMKRFSELARSDKEKSEKEKSLKPYDYVMMAMAIWEDVENNAEFLKEGLDTLVDLHAACPEARQRWMIANKAFLIARPAQPEARREALLKMKDEETDPAVSDYLSDLISKIAAPPAPSMSR